MKVIDDPEGEGVLRACTKYMSWYIYIGKCPMYIQSEHA